MNAAHPARPTRRWRSCGLVLLSVVALLIAAGIGWRVHWVLTRWLVPVSARRVPADWQSWPVDCVGVEYLPKGMPPDPYLRFAAAKLGPYVIEYKRGTGPVKAPYPGDLFVRCLHHPDTKAQRICFSSTQWLKPGWPAFAHLELRYSAAEDLYVVSRHSELLVAFRDRSHRDHTHDLRDCTPDGEDWETRTVGDLVGTDSVHCGGMNPQGLLACWRRQTGEHAAPPPAASVWEVDVGGYLQDFSAGRKHICALRIERGIRCWGAGADGRLGYGNTVDVPEPRFHVDVPLGGPAKAVSAGDSHTCALLESGDVKCWGKSGLGYGDARKIGDDETPAQMPPVPLGAPAMAIATGDSLTCALMQDGGRVRCWRDAQSARDAAVVALPAPAKAIAAGGRHACAQMPEGRLACWGDNTRGELCVDSHGAPLDGRSPDQVATRQFSEGIYAISTAPGRTCVVLEDKSVYCCGDFFGESFIQPQRVAKDRDVRHVVADGDVCVSMSPRVFCLGPTPHELLLFPGHWW